MKEQIGGFIPFDTLVGKAHYADLYKFNLGRTALLYVIQSRKYSKVYIPYLICDSIPITLSKAGVVIEYYHINESFFPMFDRKLTPDECILIVNYYGQISNTMISEFKDRYNNIIVDNTQAFFQPPIEGIDTVYTCRKWFGVPDGAYLSSNLPLANDLDYDISYMRMEHLMGRFESVEDIFYPMYSRIENEFYNAPVKRISRLTENLMNAIDYDSIIRKRKENYDVLDSQLSSKNDLHLASPNSPFMYPFYCNHGIEVRKKLKIKNCFVAIFWPNVLEFPCYWIEQRYAANILPLPCDQRYGKESMLWLADQVMLALS